MLRAVAGSSGGGSSGLTIGSTTITGGTTGRLLYDNAGTVGEAAGLTTDGTNLTLASTSQLLWSTDLILSRKGPASLQIGPSDAASPAAQTLGVQSVIAGTSNAAGVDWTIKGSAGTGTGAGGSIIFQTARTGTTGSTQNTYINTLALAPGLLGLATFGGGIVTGAGITTPAGSGLTISGRAAIFSLGSGNASITTAAGANLGTLNLGPATAAATMFNFNGTTIEVKLGDNSAFTNIKGKLTTDNAYVAGALVATGSIVQYDNTGTAYRVLCLV